jgi:hypothetical protein
VHDGDKNLRPFLSLLVISIYFAGFYLNFCREGDGMKVFGAGLLSSAAELEFVMKGIEVKYCKPHKVHI